MPVETDKRIRSVRYDGRGDGHSGLFEFGKALFGLGVGGVELEDFSEAVFGHFGLAEVGQDDGQIVVGLFEIIPEGHGLFQERSGLIEIVGILRGLLEDRLGEQVEGLRIAGSGFDLVFEVNPGLGGFAFLKKQEGQARAGFGEIGGQIDGFLNIFNRFLSILGIGFFGHQAISAIEPHFGLGRIQLGGALDLVFGFGKRRLGHPDRGEGQMVVRGVWVIQDALLHEFYAFVEAVLLLANHPQAEPGVGGIGILPERRPAQRFGPGRIALEKRQFAHLVVAVGPLGISPEEEVKMLSGPAGVVGIDPQPPGVEQMQPVAVVDGVHGGLVAGQAILKIGTGTKAVELSLHLLEMIDLIPVIALGGEWGAKQPIAHLSGDDQLVQAGEAEAFFAFALGEDRTAGTFAPDPVGQHFADLLGHRLGDDMGSGEIQMDMVVKPVQAGESIGAAVFENRGGIDEMDGIFRARLGGFGDDSVDFGIGAKSQRVQIAGATKMISGIVEVFFPVINLRDSKMEIGIGVVNFDGLPESVPCLGGIGIP